MIGKSLNGKHVLALTGVLAGTFVALLALCLDQVSRAMQVRAQADAQDYAQVHAGAFGERLLDAELALGRVMAVMAGPAERRSSAVGALASPWFESVTWVDAAGAVQPIHGAARTVPALPAAAGGRAEPGPTLLLRGGASSDTLLMVRAVSGGDSPGVLVAQLDRGYLWGRALADTRGRDVCVLYGFETPVFCSGEAPTESDRRQIPIGDGQTTGKLRWESGEEVRLGGYAHIAKASALAPAGLAVVAVQSQSSVREETAALAGRLAPFILAAVLLAWLGASAVLVRVAGMPAAGLAGGRPPSRDPADVEVRDAAVEGAERPTGASARARRAAGDPSRAAAGPRPGAAGRGGPAVPPETGDSERSVMTVLGEIDRAILSHAHFERVIDLVLAAAPRAIGCERVAVTVIDGERAKTFIGSAAQGEERSVHCADFDAAALRVLECGTEGRVIDLRDLRDPRMAPAFMQPLAQFGGDRLLLLPVFVDARIAAVLAVGLRADPAADSPARSLARVFADRLGVALTAAARDQDLRQQENYDPTTSLPNQRLLRERLGQEIARAQREGREFALMYVDLDHFRKVNASLGHLEGDNVLEQAARRMKRCLREEDVVARFSGDEFVILMPALAKGTNASRVAAKVIEVLSKPFAIAGEEHHLGATIGIAVFPQDGQTADRLLRDANIAMYRAKAAGRGQFAFFDERMNLQAVARSGLERDLRASLAKGELTLAYQPQIELRTGRINGAEALVRWDHPRRGSVPPGVFVEVAEQCGLIDALDRFVRETACAQLRDWQARRLPLPRLSINVSSIEVRRAGFMEEIRTLLASQGLRPHSIELEITEGLLMDMSEAVLGTLRSLREFGVRLAIDDFGMGFSSMGYLKKLPFDVLKVDRTFIADIGAGDDSEGVVNAILGVARSLGKEVIAEGVETEAQHAFLVREGCDGAQGYLWTRPVPADEFEKFLRNWVAVPQQPVLVRAAPRLATG